MKLNIDDAAEMLAGAAVASIGRDRSPAAVMPAALQNVQREFKELFAVLPSEEEWAGAIGSWILLNMTCEPRETMSDIFTCESWFQTALLALLDNHTLVPVLINPEVTADIAKLRKSVRFHGLFPEPEPTPEQTAEPGPAQPSESDLDNDAVNYWRANSTSDVKARMRREPDFATRINRLMSENRI